MSCELGLLRNPDYKLNQAKCKTFFGSFLHPAVPGGYPASYAEVIKFYAGLDSLPRDAKIAVVDDLFLEETAQLLAEGFTNITLVAKEDNKTNKIPDICYMTMQIRLASVVCNKEGVLTRLLKEDEAVQEKFDLCIMNPPFRVAPDVIKSSLDVADRVVCLAPLSKFKKNRAYQHVEKYEVVDAEAFEDATLTDNVVIATLSKDYRSSIGWDEFQIESTDPKYRELYRMNLKTPFYKCVQEPTVANCDPIDPDTAFAVGMRVCQNGVHTTPFCFDYRFNILRDGVSVPLMGYTDTKKYKPQYSVFVCWLPTRTAKDNFCRFWYKNPLMNELLKGLNKKGGSPVVAIPHINYSVDRDYEHLTYEDLLAIMKTEEFNPAA